MDTCKFCFLEFILHNKLIAMAFLSRTHQTAIRYLSLLFLAFLPVFSVHAQSVIVDLGLLDGTEINAKNVFDFRIINNGSYSGTAVVTGSLRYRNSPLQFSYSFTTTLHSGVNSFNKDIVGSPSWNFSSSALRELFFNYNKLPEGTYEYCVRVKLNGTNPENPLDDAVDGCTYYTINDIFLINLVDPEDDAKIYELYPMFSWVVNYPFASELTYRIRVAELKKGQNKQNAITRNNPVYQDKNVLTTGITYPITARPLEKFQPYVWTVDAYYKGILLGGAEVWKFTIIEDTLFKIIPKNQPYIELNREQGGTAYYAVGSLKLKYLENEVVSDTLHYSLTDEKGKEIRMKDPVWAVSRGENRTVITFQDVVNLKHLKNYNFSVTNSKGRTYTVRFKYVNPIYIKE